MSVDSKPIKYQGTIYEVWERKGPEETEEKEEEEEKDPTIGQRWTTRALENGNIETSTPFVVV